MTNTSKPVATAAFRKNGSSVPGDNFHLIDAPEFWKDLLVTAAKISEFLHGTPDEARGVYHIVESTNTFPTFRYGSRLAARKSVIRATFWAQERRAFRDQKEEDLVRLGVLLTQLRAIGESAFITSDSPNEKQLWTMLLIETMRTIDRVVTPK